MTVVAYMFQSHRNRHQHFFFRAHGGLPQQPGPRRGMTLRRGGVYPSGLLSVWVAHWALFVVAQRYLSSAVALRPQTPNPAPMTLD